MTRKHKSEGLFDAMRTAADESLEIATALRSGELTRARFDAWCEKRLNEGADIVGGLRERASGLARPIEAAVEQGRDMMDTLTAAPAPRPVRQHRKIRRPVKPAARAGAHARSRAG